MGNGNLHLCCPHTAHRPLKAAPAPTLYLSCFGSAPQVVLSLKRLAGSSAHESSGPKRRQEGRTHALLACRYGTLQGYRQAYPGAGDHPLSSTTSHLHISRAVILNEL